MISEKEIQTAKRTACTLETYIEYLKEYISPDHAGDISNLVKAIAAGAKAIRLLLEGDEEKAEIFGADL